MRQYGADMPPDLSGFYAALVVVGVALLAVMAAVIGSRQVRRNARLAWAAAISALWELSTIGLTSLAYLASEYGIDIIVPVAAGIAGVVLVLRQQVQYLQARQDPDCWKWKGFDPATSYDRLQALGGLISLGVYLLVIVSAAGAEGFVPWLNDQTARDIFAGMRPWPLLWLCFSGTFESVWFLREAQEQSARAADAAQAVKPQTVRQRFWERVGDAVDQKRRR